MFGAGCGGNLQVLFLYTQQVQECKMQAKVYGVWMSLRAVICYLRLQPRSTLTGSE